MRRRESVYRFHLTPVVQNMSLSSVPPPFIGYVKSIALAFGSSGVPSIVLPKFAFADWSFVCVSPPKMKNLEGAERMGMGDGDGDWPAAICARARERERWWVAVSVRAR